MNRYVTTITNTRGDSLPGYQARVLDSTGTIVDLSQDASGTPWSNDLAVADDEGVVSFFWTAAAGQTLQFLDSTGALIRAVPNFADNQNLANCFGTVGISSLPTMGTFTGTTIANDSTVKQGLQALETAVEAIPTNLAASGGSDLVGFLPTGTGASAVTVEDALKESTFDLGFATLQAALTAAAGKRIFINRNWSVSAAISIPANTDVILTPGVTITQTTSNTPVFTLSADNATLTGPGKIVGTNTEAGPDKAAIYVTGDSCTVRNMRVNGARIGIAVGTGALQYCIDNNLIWGGEADGGISADIIIYGSAGNPTRRGRVTGNRCFSNNDTAISFNSNDGDLEAIILGNIGCPMNADMTARVSNADTERRYGIVFSYNGGTQSTRIVANNLMIGCAYSGLYGISATRPVGALAFNSNIALECGFGMAAFDGTDGGLRSGILLSTAGRVIGSGNMAVNCYTTGLKIIDNGGYSDNTASRVKLGCYVSGTIDPTVTASAARAVYLTGKPAGMDLDLFVIHGSGATECAVLLDTSDVASGDVTLRGRVEVTNNLGALQIVARTGGTDTDYPVIIDGMSVHGVGQTSSEFNSGIWYQGNVHIRNFTAESFHRGINNALSTSTRRLDLVHQNVTIRDCAFGCNGSGSGLLLVEGLVCESVTTKINGCFVAGTRSTDELGNTTINISSSVIPSSAFGSLAFARGDWSKNSLTASGAALGWGHNGTSWIAGPANP